MRLASDFFELCVTCVACGCDNRTKTGTTSLIIACKNEKPQIAKLLIEHGADVNASNSQQRYACIPLPWVQC